MPPYSLLWHTARRVRTVSSGYTRPWRGERRREERGEAGVRRSVGARPLRPAERRAFKQASRQRLAVAARGAGDARTCPTAPDTPPQRTRSHGEMSRWSFPMWCFSQSLSVSLMLVSGAIWGWHGRAERGEGGLRELGAGQGAKLAWRGCAQRQAGRGAAALPRPCRAHLERVGAVALEVGAHAACEARGGAGGGRGRGCGGRPDHSAAAARAARPPRHRLRAQSSPFPHPEHSPSDAMIFSPCRSVRCCDSCTCSSILRRSIGAVAVRLTAPARPGGEGRARGVRALGGGRGGAGDGVGRRAARAGTTRSRLRCAAGRAASRSLSSQTPRSPPAKTNLAVRNLSSSSCGGGGPWPPAARCCCGHRGDGGGCWRGGCCWQCAAAGGGGDGATAAPAAAAAAAAMPPPPAAAADAPASPECIARAGRRPAARAARLRPRGGRQQPQAARARALARPGGGGAPVGAGGARGRGGPGPAASPVPSRSPAPALCTEAAGGGLLSARHRPLSGAAGRRGVCCAAGVGRGGGRRTGKAPGGGRPGFCAGEGATRSGALPSSHSGPGITERAPAFHTLRPRSPNPNPAAHPQHAQQHTARPAPGARRM
jgi:hypothetical protein